MKLFSVKSMISKEVYYYMALLIQVNLPCQICCQRSLSAIS